MKASELVIELNKCIREHGDRDVWYIMPNREWEVIYSVEIEEAPYGPVGDFILYSPPYTTELDYFLKNYGEDVV